MDSPRPKQISMTPRERKQNFVMFVQFGENLCSKRFDANDLRNTLFGLLKA